MPHNDGICIVEVECVLGFIEEEARDSGVVREGDLVEEKWGD